MIDSRYLVLFAQNNGMRRYEMKKPLLNSAYLHCGGQVNALLAVIGGMRPVPGPVKCRSNLLQLINLHTTTSNQFYRDSAVSSQVGDTHWMFHLSTLCLSLSCRFEIIKKC